MVENNDHERREFLKKASIGTVGLSTGVSSLAFSSQTAEASASDPIWTMDETNEHVVYGIETPEGNDKWTNALGSALNYVRTWKVDGSGDIPAEHEFTYGGKGFCSFSEAGSSTNEKEADLLGQGLEISEHSGAANIKIRDDPFDDVPFGVRPTADSGSSLNYGDAAIYAVDAAVGVLAGSYKEGLDVVYDGARVVYELLDTGGDTRTSTSLNYSSSHSGASENESYVRFRTRHDYYYDSEIKVKASLEHPNGTVNTTMYVYFPSGHDVEQGQESSISTTSSGAVYTEGSRTVDELEQDGYQLLTDSPKMEVINKVSATEARTDPYLQEISGGNDLKQVQYPVWGKTESESKDIHLHKGN